MYKLIISSLACLLVVSSYAQETEEKDVTADASVSDVAGSFYKDFGCSSCGGKTKK